MALCAGPSGCNTEEDLSLQAILNSHPELASRVEFLQAEPFEFGQDFQLGPLMFRLPASWTVQPGHSSREGDGPVERGRVWSLSMQPSGQSQTSGYELIYHEQVSWLKAPPAGMLDAIRHSVPRPDEFLQQFASDEELVTHIYNTVPSHLAHSRGKVLQRVRALLWMKHYMPLPVKKVPGTGIDAFIWAGVQDRCCLALAELFDASGQYRGTVSLRMEDSQPAFVEGLLARIVVSSEFPPQAARAP